MVKSFDPDIVADLREIAPDITRGIIGELDYASKTDGFLTPEQKHRLANLLHFEETQPHFLSWRVNDLPCASPYLCRLSATSRDDLDRAQPRGSRPRREARGPDGVRGLPALSAGVAARISAVADSALAAPNGGIRSESAVTFQVKIAQGLKAVPAAAWDACALRSGARGDDDPYNPFVSHAFLSALEDSGCVGAKTGWSPLHVLVEDEAEKLLGAAPCYLKSHSRASTCSTIPGPMPIPAPAGAITRSSRSRCRSRRSRARASSSRTGRARPRSAPT